MKTILKNKTRIITLVLIALFTSFFAQAQQHGQQGRQQGPPPIPNATQIVKMVNELAAELSLSDEQKTKVSELYTDHFKGVKEMMEKHQADREQNKKIMDANRKDFETQVLAIFNKKQQAKFEAFMKDKQPPQNGEKDHNNPIENDNLLIYKIRRYALQKIK